MKTVEQEALELIETVGTDKFSWTLSKNVMSVKKGEAEFTFEIDNNKTSHEVLAIFREQEKRRKRRELNEFSLLTSLLTD